MKYKKIQKARAYLEWLIIQYFQSHINTRLDFHPNVNVIIGISDHGKTAIERAVRALVFNIFPNDYRKGYKKPTVIKGKIGPNVVSRIRSSTKNEYILNNEPLEFVGKRTVPVEVQEVFNLGDINFQRQKDPPYLLDESWTGGAIARTINKLIKVDVINQLISQFTSELNHLRSQHSVWTDDLEELEKGLELYKNVDAIGERVKNCVSLCKELESAEELANSLTNTALKIRNIDMVLTNYEDLQECEDSLENITAELDEIDIKNERLKKLENITTKLQELDDEEEELEEYMQIEEDVESLYDDIAVLYNKESRRQLLVATIEKIHTIDAQQAKLDKEIATKEEELKELVEGLKVCPFCGQKITKELRHEICLDYV